MNALLQSVASTELLPTRFARLLLFMPISFHADPMRGAQTEKARVNDFSIGANDPRLDIN